MKMTLLMPVQGWLGAAGLTRKLTFPVCSNRWLIFILGRWLAVFPDTYVYACSAVPFLGLCRFSRLRFLRSLFRTPLVPLLLCPLQCMQVAARCLASAGCCYTSLRVISIELVQETRYPFMKVSTFSILFRDLLGLHRGVPVSCVSHDGMPSLHRLEWIKRTTIDHPH